MHPSILPQAAFALLLLSSAAFCAQSVFLFSPPDTAAFTGASMVFSFSFDPGNGTIGAPFCSFFLDGRQNKSARFNSTGSMSFAISNLSREAHTWSVACEDAVSATRTFVVQKLPPPDVRLRFPDGGVSLPNGTIGFIFTYDSNSDELAWENCSLAIGEAFRGWANASDGARTGATLTLAEGRYSWFVQCPAQNKAGFVDSEVRVFTVLPPPKPAPANASAPPQSNISAVSAAAAAQISISVPDNVMPANSSPPANATFAKLIVPAQADEGSPMELKLIDADLSPITGKAIRIAGPGGFSKTITTDARGIASFTPNSTGEYSYSAEGVLLPTSSVTEITKPAPAAAMPPAQGQSKINPVSGGLVQSALDSLRSQIGKLPFNPLLFAGACVLLVLAIGAAAAFLLARKKPGTPEDGMKKITLTEVK